MTRSILVGDVRTGRRITQIPVSDASWSMVHRAGGDISVSIPLGAEDFAALERHLAGLYPGPDLFLPFHPTAETSVWRPGDGLRPEFLAALEPVKSFLAVVEGDTVLEAGPIWRWEFNAGTNVLTVGASGGIWSLLGRRYVIDDLAAEWAEWAVTFSGMSLGTIAKRLIELTTWAESGELPIVLPEDETATADVEHTRTFYGYEMATVRERIEQLMGVEGGPDVAFIPRLTADRKGVEWVMRVGSDADPLLAQSSPDWTFDARTPRSGVSGISVVRDATELTSRAWALGSGMETATLIEVAEDVTLPAAGYPRVEYMETRSTVEDPDTLRRWAEGFVTAKGRPWLTWTMTVRADIDPRLGTYRPGDWARVWVSRSNPLLAQMLPEGFYRVRILNVSGNLGPEVTITMMPVREIR